MGAPVRRNDGPDREERGVTAAEAARDLVRAWLAGVRWVTIPGRWRRVAR